MSDGLGASHSHEFSKDYVGFEISRVLALEEKLHRSGSCDRVFWFMSSQAAEFRMSRLLITLEY